MQNKILYIQRGKQLYHKSEGNIIGKRGLHSLGGIKQKKTIILKFAQKKQQSYSKIIPQFSSNTVEETLNENYTDLLPVEMLDLLSKYPTAKNSGIIYITNVVLNTLCNDTTTTVTRDLPFYNAFSFGTYLVLGKTYTLTITICDINITYPAAIVSVWIDWNQTNSYNEEDWIQVTSNTPVGESATIEIAVPPTAKIGTTGMRIRSRGASGGNKNGPRDAYVDMGSGDTQDYPVTILSEEL